MASNKKYLSLEEAASQLKIKTEELIRFRERGDIRGFADRGTWKFKAEDVEEFARRRQPDSDPEVAIIDDDDLDLDSGSAIIGNVMDDGDDELGRQATVIRKNRETASDSDVRLLLDPGMKGSLTGSSGEIPIVAPMQSDSDVRLIPDSGRRKTEAVSDSDVKLINPAINRPDSDSDVKLVEPGKSKSGDSDSDVKLAQSDSDVKLLPEEESDSDSDVKLIKPKVEMSSDSDVALAPAAPSRRGRDTAPLDFDVAEESAASASALFDDDPGITLPGQDSGIRLGGDSGIRLGGDSGIRLGGDSGIRLGGDSGIQLQQPADSGILLEGDDSGLALDDPEESGIRLGGESGIRLDDSKIRRRPSGSSKVLPGSSIKLPGSSKVIPGSKKPKDGSSVKLKGRKSSADMDATAPMLLAKEDSSDDLSATAPMLLQQDDDLSGDDMQVPLLEETAAETSVIMFEDEDSDQASATVVKKGRKTVESAFDLEDEETAEAEDEDELEVSEEVLGEDDELEDLDAFASDEDEFDEGFEAGASRIGFAAPAGKIAAVPQEVEWGAAYFVMLLVSSFALLGGALISVDLLRTTWAAGDPSIYPGELLGMIGDLLK